MKYAELTFIKPRRRLIAQNDYAEISCMLFSWTQCPFYRAINDKVCAYMLLTDEEYQKLKNDIKICECKDYYIKLNAIDTLCNMCKSALDKTFAPADAVIRAFEDFLSESDKKALLNY